MAKKPKITPAAEAPEAAANKPLTETQRAERVLVSQGRPIGMLSCFPAATQQQLAALCNAKGEIHEDAPQLAGTIIADFYAAQKAEVDQESFSGFGAPQETPQPEAGQPNK